MKEIRILHIDDEADIREVIEISLGIDPAFTVRSAGSGAEGLTAAAEWDPDAILLDVMMPSMDGPTTLARLRESPQTAGIPVIFMTARAQSREVDRLRALGAIGVIPKPFDPMTLAATVRDYLRPAVDPFEDLRTGFLKRVGRDLAALSEDRAALRDGVTPPQTLERIRHIAHSLAGAGGIYGFAEISEAATAVEDATLAEIEGTGTEGMLSAALDDLIAHAPGSGSRQRAVEQVLTG